MSERKVPLGAQLPDGLASCGFGIDPNLCGKPATRHVLWAADNENILCCDQHFHDYVFPKLVPGECDFHTFGGVCSMPGTRWKFSEGEHEGFCFFDLPDAVDLSEELAPMKADA